MIRNSGRTGAALPDCTPGPDATCSLCGDVAVRATIVAIDADTGMATVDVDSRQLIVALDLLDGAFAGDTVLVHQGFAIARVDTP